MMPRLKDNTPPAQKCAVEVLLASGVRSVERLRALVHFFSCSMGNENNVDAMTLDAWSKLKDWQKEPQL